VRPDGTYPTAPLEKDIVVFKVVQNESVMLQMEQSIDGGLEENPRRMAHWINIACNEGKKPDFILFNEFPLTGYSSGSRSEKLKFTIQVPGPETDAIGEMAKDCDTYVVFGSYVTDPDWPGHILSLNPVIGRDGEIKHVFWKSRNATRIDADGEILTTTIENVHDKFLAKYGLEAEFPVLQTEYGNIAVSTVQMDLFVFAAYAMRGVEIMLRTATGFSIFDIQAIAYYNNFYSAMSNVTFPTYPDLTFPFDPNIPTTFDGDSLIVAPGGRILAQAPTGKEAIIEAEINIAALRKDRRIPRYPMEVVRPVFDQFVQELPLNHLDVPREDLPETRGEMKDMLDRKNKWLNPIGDGG
jgi:predicted amidohydrolase